MTNARIDPPDGRINQGDVISNVDLIEYVREKEGYLDVSMIHFPYVVVLTQDCDLHQDSRAGKDGHAKENLDKWILSVLVAPMFNAEHVYEGIHMEMLGIKSQVIQKKRSPGTALQSNQNPRYHYINLPEYLNIVPLVIDFKNYFSITVDTLVQVKRENYICSIESLYREDISQRFASFLSRIGLPDQIIGNQQD